ncbi:GntR family transcriptional regulator [Streptomyces sp. NPDC056682]|uniref:GntR family transcriptional regulator n=1 Tax=Streptomyces sp. NPDC056682 TaxID=3345909 RepID=UPI0036A9B256
MHEQVADRIAEQIRTGDYKTGERLPSEADMVEAYEVGRTTVRKALAELRDRGIIDVQQGKPSTVRKRPSGRRVTPSVSADARTGRRYLQLAQLLAEKINGGEYAPGERLPSENEMVQAYGVGKATVRAAIAELRSLGLIDVRQGKGSIVRAQTTPGPARAVDRSISRAASAWSIPELPEAEAPTVSRTSLNGLVAALLDQQDQDALSIDRLLFDPSSGARIAHRLLIPMATAADTPSLARTPDALVTEMYAQLADSVGPLTFFEEVTARAPLPDERAALELRDSSPLLVTYRITSAADTGRPLLCEELKAPSTVRLRFPLTPSEHDGAARP